MSHFQILPVAFGIVALITVAAAAHYYFSKSSSGGKKKKLTTLLGPTQKVLLPLIEKEEISHDTKRESFIYLFSCQQFHRCFFRYHEKYVKKNLIATIKSCKKNYKIFNGNFNYFVIFC